MQKTQKSFFVENLTKELESAKAAILVDFAGLDVAKQQELKSRLREVGAIMKVTKNTLFALAGKSAKLPKEIVTDTVLTGQTAVVLTEADPLAPLQVLAKFAKEFAVPQLKVGIVEGSFQDKDALEKLSMLPAKDVLYAQVIGSIASPAYGLISTLNSNMQKLVYVISEASKKGGDN